MLAGCGKEIPKLPPPPLEVSTITVKPRDVDVSAEYIAQTQSSQAVNIQARVSGFLDKRVYTEGAVVKAGQVLFRMDPKPFQAQLDAANAALQRNQAALHGGHSQPEPHQAAGGEERAVAEGPGRRDRASTSRPPRRWRSRRRRSTSAQLDLCYTVISSPVNGVSSYAAVADGTYLSPQNSQLTTVSVLSPMWVNFSLSENEFQRIENDIKAGRLRLPPDRNMTVEIEQADGSLFPFTGKITFADPSYNAQTGTFLIRATVDNPQGRAAAQPVRARAAARAPCGRTPSWCRSARCSRAARAISSGCINKDGKAEQRPVVVGDWYGDSWFINEGLKRRRPARGRRRAAPVARAPR